MAKVQMITFDELEKALGRADRGGREVPEGFLTSKEWAMEWAVSVRTAQMRISDATEAGMVHMRKFRRKSMDGGNYYTSHYKIVPKETK